VRKFDDLGVLRLTALRVNSGQAILQQLCAVNVSTCGFRWLSCSCLSMRHAGVVLNQFLERGQACVSWCGVAQRQHNLANLSKVAGVRILYVLHTR
jgi:hypothetical protein